MLKNNRNWPRVMIAVACGLTAILSLGAAEYTLTDLGVPTGHSSAVAIDINNVGGIAVNADNGVASQAYFYSGGAFTSIPTSLLGNSKVAADINDHNEIVGSYLDTVGTSHGFYYNGTTHTFQNADHSSSSSGNHALAINNSGAILGAVTGIVGTDGGSGGAGPWIFSSGSAFDVSPLVATDSRVFDLNNNEVLLSAGHSGLIGQYYTWNSNLPHAAHFPEFLFVPTFTDGLTILNDNGLIAGANGGGLSLVNSTLGFMAPMVNVGTLGGGITLASNINNNGWVVGNYKGIAGQQEGFLYNGSNLLSVNSLIDPSLLAAGWNLTSARGINEAGDIVGGGLAPDGRVHAYLLTPSAVPEPSTYGVIGAAILLGLAGLNVRRKN